MTARNQLELNLAGRRPRAVLISSEPPPPIGVPTSLTLSDRGKEMFIGYSPWFSAPDTPPPCSGIWEVKINDEEPVRLLYSHDLGTWSDSLWPWPRVLVEYQWRGLAQDWHEVFGHEVKQERRRAVLIGD